MLVHKKNVPYGKVMNGTVKPTCGNVIPPVASCIIPHSNCQKFRDKCFANGEILKEPHT